MATKYDTNPLDSDFPERAKAEAEAQFATQTLPSQGGETRKFTPPPMTEEETRRFAPPDLHGFSSPYNGQYAPANYQGVGFAGTDQSLTRKVSKVGLPENIMTALPYIPWYLGLVAGVLILFFVPKSEAKVRFHAAQGLAAHIAILLVTTILGVIGNITDVAEVGNLIFVILTTVMLFVFAYRAWKGRPVHIESVESLTNWLEEKISPSKTEV